MVESRQGYAVLLATGLLLCCGGQSARTTGSRDSETSGGSPNAGTSGQPSEAVGGSTSVGGTGGANGSAGAAGSGLIDVTQDNECTRWEGASVTDSCDLLRNCPTDLWSYVATLQDNKIKDSSRARVGCGLVDIRSSSSPYDGSTLVFEEGGSLAGYSFGSDQPWGPCDQNIYERGSTLDDCDTVRECDIAVDARTTKQICGCTCPDDAPPGGVASAEVTCIYPPILADMTEFVGCPLELFELDRRASETRGALMYSGCEQTIVSMLGVDNDIVECVYRNHTWVGARRTEAEASKECANVEVWQTGEYATCATQTSCWLGTDGPPEGVERCPRLD